MKSKGVIGIWATLDGMTIAELIEFLGHYNPDDMIFAKSETYPGGRDHDYLEVYEYEKE